MTSYPKPPSAIFIRSTKEVFDATTCALEVKLKEYLSQLGKPDHSFMMIFMELLTHGKVCLDFDTVSERLELMDPADQLASGQAANLLYDFCKTQTVTVEMKKKTTLRIPVPMAVAKGKPTPSEMFKEGDRVRLKTGNFEGTVSTTFVHHSGLRSCFVKWDPQPGAPDEGCAYFASDLIRALMGGCRPSNGIKNVTQVFPSKKTMQ